MRRLGSHCARLAPLALLHALAATPACGQQLQTSFWIPDGPVHAMAWSPGEERLYVGGAFDRVGPATGGAAIVDATTGLVLTPYLGAFTFGSFFASVNAVVSDGSGGWFAGGFFTRFGGFHTNLVHVLPSGSVDQGWTCAVNGTVHALHRSGTTLYVGGDFTSLGGQARSGIGAVATSNGLATSWDPAASGGPIYFIREFSGVLYVGGLFTTIGGAARNRVAALSPATALASPWNPNANNAVRAIHRGATYIALGGDFGQVGGQPRQFSALVNSTTGAVLPAFDANAPVRALESDGTLLWVGGDFTTLAGQPRNRLAAVVVSTGALSGSWTPALDGAVESLALGGGRLYVGGRFNAVGAQDRAKAAAFDASSAALLLWAPQAGGTVHTVGAGATVFLGGEFVTANFVRRKNLAAFSLSAGPTYGQAVAWSHDLPGGAVRALRLVAPTGGLLVGGDFADADPGTPDYLARIDTGTGVADPWAPSPDGPVWDLDIRGGAIFAAGGFAGFPGQGVGTPDFAGISDTTSLVLPGFESALTTPTVFRVRQANWFAPVATRLYLAGSFTAVRGSSRAGLAAWGVGTGALEPWEPFPDDSLPGAFPDVKALYVDGVSGVVTAGGSFSYGLAPRHNLLAFDQHTALALPWAPNPDAAVHALMSYSDRLYVAGPFGQIDGANVNGLAAFMRSGSRARISWVPAITDLYSLPGWAVHDLEPAGFAASANCVAVGGVFETVNGFFRPYLAVINDTSPSVDVPSPGGALVPGLFEFGPNPFRANGAFRFALARAGRVTLSVCDVQGREVVRPLDRAWLAAGDHRVEMAGASLPPGLYWARLATPEGTQRTRLVRVD